MNRGESEDRQRERDREYAEAWNNLSAKERRQLAEAGIIGPELPVYNIGKHDQESLLERCASPVETTPDDCVVPTDPGHHGEDAQSALRRLIGELLASDNIRLTLECLSLVTGISYDGASMTTLAKRHGVTRAAVSKRCVSISETFGLPPSRAMRRVAVREIYEQRQHRILNRNDHFHSDNP